MSADADAVDYSAEPSTDTANGGFNFAGAEDAAQADDGVQQMQEDDSNAAGDAQSAQVQGTHAFQLRVASRFSCLCAQFNSVFPYICAHFPNKCLLC
jgi:hypothetical protein